MNCSNCGKPAQFFERAVGRYHSLYHCISCNVYIASNKYLTPDDLIVQTLTNEIENLNKIMLPSVWNPSGNKAPLIEILKIKEIELKKANERCQAHQKAQLEADHQYASSVKIVKEPDIVGYRCEQGHVLWNPKPSYHYPSGRAYCVLCGNFYPDINKARIFAPLPGQG